MPHLAAPQLAAPHLAAQTVIPAIERALDASLLRPDQRRRLDPGDHPTTGHCYVAAEAAYHLLGGAEAGWTPWVASYIDCDGAPNTHWWLDHADGTRCDPTLAQFAPAAFPDGPPYAIGRRCGFLTRTPSRRARVVMDRVLGSGWTAADPKASDSPTALQETAAGPRALETR